ncbi:MAG: TrmH family RNA methyltransferase [Kiritimatiellae bacterium]|nr:TrmH family RNA methyltransferase [Kiritimatiellia bacterium]
MPESERPIPNESGYWKAALERLQRVDRQWPAEGTEDPEIWAAHESRLAACRTWLAAQPVPRLAKLADQLQPGVPRRRFWCALVPAERAVTRSKITDLDILTDDLPQTADPPQPPIPVTVLLDSIRSAFNVGGIFRTAECFGFREVILCGYTPGPDNPQVAKAALGPERQIPWRTAISTRDAILACLRQGIPCYALETVAQAEPLERFAWPLPCALVIGNERFGIDAETIALCDGMIRIPLFGRKNSLNVGCAFAVVAHAIRTSLMAKPSRTNDE